MPPHLFGRRPVVLIFFQCRTLYEDKVFSSLKPVRRTLCFQGVVDISFSSSQGVVDPKVEVVRLTKKLLKLEKDERRVMQIVTSPGYLEKSPPHVQQDHHMKVSLTIPQHLRTTPRYAPPLYYTSPPH